MKWLLLVSLLIFNNVALGCALGPKTSPEYDALINISKPDSKGIYSITVPKNVASTKYLPILILMYTNSKNKNIDDVTHTQNIKPVVKEDSILGYFSIDKSNGKKAYVYVLWSAEGGMCSIYGYSNFIEEM